MFESELVGLDPAATLAEAVEARAAADRAEVRLLELAAHWADLHGLLDPADSRQPFPGVFLWRTPTAAATSSTTPAPEPRTPQPE